MLRTAALSLAAGCLLVLSPSAIRADEPENPSAPIPVILDTDIGTDIDDAFALGLCLTSPELQLLGVTTVSADAFTRAMIACRLLQHAGRDDVPVASGKPRRPVPALQEQYQFGLRPAQKYPVKQSAVEFLYEQLKARPKEITVIAVGELTNIAELFTQHPEAVGLMKRLVIMGGSVRVGYNNQPPAEPEWNIKSDVAAAKQVFASGVPLTVAPLDATTMLKLNAEHRSRIFNAGAPITDSIFTLYSLWNRETPVLYDPVAVTLVFRGDFCRMEQLRLQVDDKGTTRIEPGEPNALVATSIDADRYLAWYVDRMASHRLRIDLAADATITAQRRKLSHDQLRELVLQLAKANPNLPVELRASEKLDYAAVAQAIKVCTDAGAAKVAIDVLPPDPQSLNRSKFIPADKLPARVHTFEDFESDVERRWWLSGREETKDVPPSRSASLPNRRACRAMLTRDFNGRQSDASRLWKAVIFNPVPGPPMGDRARLSFRYKLSGADTLRVQIYSLSNGYHRFLTIADVPQGEWREATVDMRDARRTDGTGGELSRDERIDDIQFYVPISAELLIDDIVLYEAADEAESASRETFPARVSFTGWFDTGKQGQEWPGRYEIVLHEKPRTWDAAKSIVDEKEQQSLLEIGLRGQRPLGNLTRMKWLYRADSDAAVRIALLSGGTILAEQTWKPSKTGEWDSAAIDFPNLHSRSGPVTADTLKFTLPQSATLFVDDLLLYEPGN